MKWIDVKKRVPNGGDEFASEIVLAYNSYYNAPEILFYWKKAKHWNRHSEYITHWQPLPKPPTE